MPLSLPRRLITALALILGLAAVGGLIAFFNVDEILSLLSRFGFDLFAVAAFQCLPIAATAAAWHALLARAEPAASFSRCYRGRFIADGINAILPVAQIGGEVVRARLLAQNGVPMPVAAASVVIDLTIGFIALAVYIFGGLGGLLILTHGQHLPPGIIIGLAAFMGLLLLLVLAQKFGLVGIIGKKLGISKLAAETGSFEKALSRLYAERARLITCFFWRILGWLLGGIATWLIFYLLGSPVTLGEALVIESLVQAARNVAFAVPGGLGVQEGAYVFASLLLGKPAEPALALALIKRGRDLILGLPALLWWHLEESDHWLRRRKISASREPPAGQP